MEQTKQEQIENLVDAFTKAFGTYNQKEPTELFINAFMAQHRTHQQSLMKLMLSVVEFVASDEYKTDLRNEGSKKICKQIVEGFLKQQEVTHPGLGKEFPPSTWLQMI
jgi:mannitol/fructose-specific phosphotransferase system IIA component (Ntr-type)